MRQGQINDAADTLLVGALLDRARYHIEAAVTSPSAAFLPCEIAINFSDRIRGGPLELIAAIRETIADYDLEALAAGLTEGKGGKLEPTEDSHAESERLVCHIGAARTIYRDNRGCSTPAEEFASGVLSYWRPGSPPLTPVAAERMLAEFRQNFDDMRNDSRAFLSRYPEAVEVA